MAKNSRFTIKTKEMLIEPVDEANIWEGDWTITIFDDKKPIKIGTATFAGEKMYGTIPISVTLDEEYRNKKYGTEVYKLMVGFAFGFRDIYEVKAVTEEENDKCRHALEKAGFVHRNTEHHIETLSITKPKSTWLGLYVYIGIIVGLILGIVVGSTWVGLVIGLVIGLFFGAIMDNEAKKAREKVTGRPDRDD